MTNKQKQIYTVRTEEQKQQILDSDYVYARFIDGSFSEIGECVQISTGVDGAFELANQHNANPRKAVIRSAEDIEGDVLVFSTLDTAEDIQVQIEVEQ